MNVHDGNSLLSFFRDMVKVARSFRCRQSVAFKKKMSRIFTPLKGIYSIDCHASIIELSTDFLHINACFAIKAMCFSLKQTSVVGPYSNQSKKARKNDILSLAPENVQPGSYVCQMFI